jgi:hypothetical protein
MITTTTVQPDKTGTGPTKTPSILQKQVSHVRFVDDVQKQPLQKPERESSAYSSIILSMPGQ